jgi:hypothetical protein
LSQHAVIVAAINQVIQAPGCEAQRQGKEEKERSSLANVGQGSERICSKKAGYQCIEKVLECNIAAAQPALSGID